MTKNITFSRQAIISNRMQGKVADANSTEKIEAPEQFIETDVQDLRTIQGLVSLNTVLLCLCKYIW